jgi:predicted nucleotidyltransferase
MWTNDERLPAEVRAHPYPLLFATVSGAHLYGFASADSDWDLRGAHLLPLGSVAGLEAGEETVKRSTVRDGAEVDLVTHEAPRRVKPLLYVYRVLLTGIHLMRTGEVNASLPACNARMRLPWVADLVARKTEGGEQQALGDADVDFHRGEYLRLCAMLVEASEASALPPTPTVRRELHDLLLRVRLGEMAAATA